MCTNHKDAFEQAKKIPPEVLASERQSVERLLFATPDVTATKEMNIDWGKAPEGAIGAFVPTSAHLNRMFFVSTKIPSSHDNKPGFEGVKADGSTRYHVFQYCWQWIPRPAKTLSWSGEGLPPVGVVCQLRFDYWEDWQRYEILCHGKSFIFARELNSGYDRERSLAMDGIEFRPIRTPEQVAAEKRLKFAQLWLEDIEKEYGTEVADKLEDILIEAEIRKQVTP